MAPANFSCHKRITWNTEKGEREADYRAARSRALGERQIAERYKIAQKRLAIVYHRVKRKDKDLELDFKAHVERWRSETMHLSTLTRRFLHPSYLHIISLGRPVLPLLLAELRTRPDHWLVALNAITGSDPAPEGANFSEAVSA